MSESKLDVWYQGGIHFKCTGCGKCCTGAPGYVWLTDEDIQTLAKKLNLTEKEFLQTHCRFVHNRYSLKEKPVTYDCVFLNGKLCNVYDARPKQCRKFPFWPENFTSKAAWDELKTSCEGVEDKTGDHFSKEIIEAKLSE